MAAVNVKGALWGMQAAVPHFLERKAGHLINVGSVLAKVPVASWRSAYSASSAALASLTSNLRMDVRTTHPQVHVSLVLPGLVAETGFNDAVVGSNGEGFLVGWVNAGQFQHAFLPHTKHRDVDTPVTVGSAR